MKELKFTCTNTGEPISIEVSDSKFQDISNQFMIEKEFSDMLPELKELLNSHGFNLVKGNLTFRESNYIITDMELSFRGKVN